MFEDWIKEKLTATAEEIGKAFGIEKKTLDNWRYIRGATNHHPVDEPYIRTVAGRTPARCTCTGSGRGGRPPPLW